MLTKGSHSLQWLRATVAAVAVTSAIGCAAMQMNMQPQNLRNGDDALFFVREICRLDTQAMIGNHQGGAVPPGAIEYILVELAKLDPNAPHMPALVAAIVAELGRSGYVDLKHVGFGELQILAHPDVGRLEIIAVKNGTIAPEMIDIDLNGPPKPPATKS